MRTNFGPEESEELYREVTKQERDNKARLRHDLIQQIHVHY
jgi:hypothetical protein